MSPFSSDAAFTVSQRGGSNQAETDIIDCVSELVYDSSSVRARDVLTQMRDAAKIDAKRLAELSEQRQALAEAHNRYVANVREAHATAESLRAIQAFVGSEQFEKWTGDAVLWMETDIPKRELRDETALWQHLMSCLRFIPEARISELKAILEEVGIKATRPAIESAVKAHPNVFGVHRQGLERVVFLKGPRP